jgi:antitoxin (DNA-binding transcriptional repressor) of toxin-antitoxin stability system
MRATVSPLELVARLTNMVTGATIHAMKQINVAQAKARLPELIERAANGEVIVLARGGKPRAKLVALDAGDVRLRRPGKGKGRFRMRKDFDEPLPDDLLDLFEGKGRP